MNLPIRTGKTVSILVTIGFIFILCIPGAKKIYGSSMAYNQIRTGV